MIWKKLKSMISYFKPEEDDGIPFEEKMKTLTSELDELFKESNELESKIRQSLKEIGFEF